MASLLRRLGESAHRRWPIVIALWLAVLVGIGGFAATQSKPLVDSFTIPGIAAEDAQDLQAELFASAEDPLQQATAQVVVQAPEGSTLADPEVAREVDALIAELGGLPQLPDDVQLVNPVMAAQGLEQQLRDQYGQSGLQGAALDEQVQRDLGSVSPLSDDGTTGLISFVFDVDSPTEVEPDTREQLYDALDDARDAGLVAEANGQGLQALTEFGVTSELIGIGVALLVLLLTFWSLVAAGLPILSALIGVGIGALGVLSVTAFTDVGTTTPLLATMLGLAVGIDYALFILARYRSELDDLGEGAVSDPARRRRAIGFAVGTAGSAVVFAGVTVMIALAGLAVVGIPFLTSMGVAAAATVAVAVLVALTLLPAVLGMIGGKAFGGRVRRVTAKRDADGEVHNNGVRWARVVGKAPLVAIAVVVVGLGALAIPGRELQLAFPTDATSSPDTTNRQASDLVAEEFGPGRESPLLVVVDAREPVEAAVTQALQDAGGQPDEAALREAVGGVSQEVFGAVVQWAGSADDVQNAQIAGVNEDGTGAQVLVTPSSGPSDTATEDLLADLRDRQADVEEETGATLGVTGLTAIQVDTSERLAEALPIYLALVIGLAFLLLMVVFRSILVPLTATIGFLFSVLATIGATVAVFQEGVFGLFDPAPIISFMPVFLVGVVFGLAMDYQVFLVTRMREAYVHGAAPRDAVVAGFRTSARVVAAAAVIMIAVFAAFILQEQVIIASMGFALAVAVLLDAFVIRMTFIPALMYLMGEKAWWLPRWLDRVLPRVDVEGETLQRGTHAAEVPDDADTDAAGDTGSTGGTGGAHRADEVPTRG